MTTCEALSAKIVSDEKNLSIIEVSGFGDDSAPRGTNRQMRQVVLLNAIQANLQLMQANKCPVRQDAIGANFYKVDAMSCSSARMKSTSTDEPKECDKSTWKRMDLP